MTPAQVSPAIRRRALDAWDAENRQGLLHAGFAIGLGLSLALAWVAPPEALLAAAVAILLAWAIAATRAHRHARAARLARAIWKGELAEALEGEHNAPHPLAMAILSSTPSRNDPCASVPNIALTAPGDIIEPGSTATLIAQIDGRTSLVITPAGAA